MPGKRWKEGHIAIVATVRHFAGRKQNALIIKLIQKCYGRGVTSNAINQICHGIRTAEPCHRKMMKRIGLRKDFEDPKTEFKLKTDNIPGWAAVEPPVMRAIKLALKVTKTRRQIPLDSRIKRTPVKFVAPSNGIRDAADWLSEAATALENLRSAAQQFEDAKLAWERAQASFGDVVVVKP